RGPGPRAGGRDGAILRRRRRDERVEEPLRRRGDLVHCTLERFLVRARRPVEAADLADVLERRAADLFVGRPRLEVEQLTNVPTHAPDPMCQRGKARAACFARSTSGCTAKNDATVTARQPATAVWSNASRGGAPPAGASWSSAPVRM